MGAVNAIATLAACLPAVIWWACHRPNRLWWRYTAWWALALVLAMLWWVVALVLLRAISPPFLDFIESSGVTTQWSSLVEMLRGTDGWTPFVAPTATAGAPLVTGSAAILGTCLVAAAGLAGLASREMPARGRLVTMLLIGVVLMAAGYSGGLGSPVAHQVQAFLDASGAPLRNVHKLESVIRIPLVLGVTQLLGRIPLPGWGPGSAPVSAWLSAFAHPERDKRVAVGVVVLTGLAVSTSLAWTGRLAPPGTFAAIPQYWHEAADWLSEHDSGTPMAGRVLVVPGAPFATQMWGTSHDEPLQVLGSAPWGVRDSIPLTPTANHQGAGRGATPVRRRAPICRTCRYPCPPRHFLSGVAQRSGSRLVALGAPDPGAPHHRGVAGAAGGSRSSVRRWARAPWPASSPIAVCARATRP